jgi:PBP1b-binding outer membrane lipoprotein LpoB
MKKSIVLAATLCAILAGCSKEPDSKPAAAPAPNQVKPAAPAVNPGPAVSSPAAGAAAQAGNPDASKDPVFNMPAQPVLDVTASKAAFNKIVSDSLK